MVAEKLAGLVRHNGSMLTNRNSAPSRAAWLVILFTCVAMVSACTSPSKSEATPTPGAETSASPSESPSATVAPPPPPYYDVPAGVELTLPGFELALGDKATVAWKLPKPPPAKGKKKKKKAPVAAVTIKVKSIEAATLKAFAGWDLNKGARQSNPFFVRASVKNVGKTDLSDVRMPLYIVDGNNTLIQASTFEGDFKPCASTPFPAKFKPGKKVKLCNVYLSPKNGRLTAVSFRPVPTFDPITWTGSTVPYQAKKGKKKDKSTDPDQ